jgi:hypothetical protein
MDRPRLDLTAVECCAVLGGLIGGLAQLTDLDTVREAIRWWARKDEAWTHLESIQELSRSSREQVSVSRNDRGVKGD